jgi:hypothetical protein
MQEYKRRQFRGHPLSLAGKSLRTEGFRGVLASRAQLGLGDQLRFETTFPRSLSRRRFETLVCRLFRDRVDGTHAEAPPPPPRPGRPRGVGPDSHFRVIYDIAMTLKLRT